VSFALENDVTQMNKFNFIQDNSLPIASRRLLSESQKKEDVKYSINRNYWI